MSYLEALLTLLRWKQQGWDVHPINVDLEFQGWI